MAVMKKTRASSRDKYATHLLGIIGRKCREEPQVDVLLATLPILK